jgi:putative DNA methylase
MREAAHADFPLNVYYAFKQSESEAVDDSGIGLTVASTGWETMLTGLLDAKFQITGTWPMRSELANRMVASGTNALASSIVLVCRPRLETAPTATRREFLTALRRELPQALRELQQGSIAPVDLAQASIGPGMAVFSRYARVLESDGRPMPVRAALAIINGMLDEVLTEQEGEFDADTRWALAWFEQFGVNEGVYGDAETLSKAKNTSVAGMVEAGIVRARSGKVKLLWRSELPNDWNPRHDRDIPVWEATQHLVKRLEDGGEEAAAALLAALGSTAEIARDLAYRLYSLCERKKWAQEALAYNALVSVWPELTRLAANLPQEPSVTQPSAFGDD